MRYSFWIILLITTVVYSCKKDSEDEVDLDLGTEYAGLEVGKYVIYDVDSFFYDDFTGTIDTSLYQIKEEVDSKFTDLEGEEAFKIIRYRKEIDSTNWVLIDVWNSKTTATNFQKVEENVRFVKLLFPVREDKSWNGNAMNNQGSMTYEYDYVDVAETIGGIALNEVLKVTQFEEVNLIQQQLFEEKYARGIGMVYKKSVDMTRTSLSNPWLGYDITMTLSSYGN